MLGGGSLEAFDIDTGPRAVGEGGLGPAPPLGDIPCGSARGGFIEPGAKPLGGPVFMGFIPGLGG